MPICSVPFTGTMYTPPFTGVSSGTLKVRSTSRSSTVTIQVAVLPLWVVAVIVVTPRPTAVTAPSCTRATAGLLLVQATLRSWASAGCTSAVSVNSSSGFSSASETGPTVTPSAGVQTVISQDALIPLLSAAVAVMVAVPALTPVTTPEELIVATVVSLLSQFTPLSLASPGETVAFSVSVSPAYSVALLLSSATPVAYCFTVIWQVALLPLPSAAVDVMVAVPAFSAVTTPSATVATDSLLLDQVTVLSVASLGVMMGVSVDDVPA